MNREQRLLLIIFAVIVVILLGAIIGINVFRKGGGTGTEDGTIIPTAEPTAEVPDQLAGLTEDEIAAMAMQEEEGDDDFISAFDDTLDLLDHTANPNATEEPID